MTEVYIYLNKSLQLKKGLRNRQLSEMKGNIAFITDGLKYHGLLLVEQL